MSRPNLTLTPEESARLKGEDWKVPSHAVAGERRNKKEGTTVATSRWAEVGVITEATIDEDENGLIKGRIGLFISDEDHHRNTNPRHRLTVWLKVRQDLVKNPPPPEGDPDRGPYYNSLFSVRHLESFLRALGETGILANRKHLRDFGALYDFLQSSDLSGREVLVNLEYPPSYNQQVEPDVRYFDVVS